jgi:hypothetical protein
VCLPAQKPFGIFKEDPAQQARFMMLATDRGRL